MLKFERRQIAADIAGGIRPYVQAFTAGYGALPEGYWEDEYVLGFLPALTGLFARAMTRDKLAERDALSIVREALDAISNGFGGQIMAQVDRLTLTQPQDFVAGARAASKIMALSTGQIGIEDSDLQAACQVAGVNPAEVKARAPAAFSAAANAMVQALFYDIVKNRLIGDIDLPPADETLEVETEADGSVRVRF